MGCRGSLRLTLALGLLACGDPSDPGDEIRGFRVTAREPANGATGVPLHARMSATLSAEISSEIPISSIRLTLGNATVPYAIGFDPAAHRLEFRAPLLPGSTYRAALSADLRSSTGDSLVGPREWTFTTRPWDPAAITSIGKLGIIDAAFAPDGGVHLIGEGEYYFKPGNDVASSYPKYVTCAAPCSAPGNWSRVALDSAWLPGAGMGVELDAGGVVHLVHFSASPAPPPDFGPSVIRYLRCSVGCSNPGSWTGTTIDSTPEFTPSWALAGFAVSREGAVHLLSYSAWGGLPDLRYAACPEQCSTAGNWTFASIPVTGYPSGSNPLQVDQFGRLHLLTNIDHVLTYSTCAGDCTSAAAWSSGPVRPADERPVGGSMVADAFGRIHVVHSDPSPALSYAVCEADCTEVGSWAAIRLDVGGYLGNAIAVDPEGRITAVNPVNDAGELRYLSCVSSCLDPSSWEMAAVERPDIFQLPSPGPPRLAASSDGSVRMAYNTTGHDLHYLE